MIILSHRGYWKELDERNTRTAFARSFDLGFGTETDLRDCLGKIVIAHDMPKGDEMPFEEVLQIMNGRNLPLALNIKADGLADGILELLKKYGHTNYFTFDMAIPDMVVQIKRGLWVFTGLSDILQVPVMLDQSAGVWLDCFNSDWYGPDTIDDLIAGGKSVCIVSSDLHKRATDEQWAIVRKCKHIDTENLLLCTDYPEQAKEFFCNTSAICLKAEEACEDRMDTESILEAISNNPSAFNIVAVGDKKRYDANKILLGERSRYVEEISEINDENTDVIVVCGHSPKVMTKKHPTVHVSQVINSKSRKYWDSTKEYIGINLNHYGSNPYIAEYVQRTRKIDTFDFIRKCASKNGGRKLKLLSIGCGCGHLERKFLETEIFSEIHGCDISMESIQTAIEKAREVDTNDIISYFVHDANSEDFPDQYDVIYAANSVHHIENLEFFYESVKKALNTNGIFIQTEYTGASRFQHSDRLIASINFLLSLLPQRYRTQYFQRPVLECMIHSDPSEAVRSDEIIPLTKRYFPKTRAYKFTDIMMHLLYQCVNADKFHTRRWRTRGLCSIVFNTEKILNMCGLINKGYAICISEAEQ